MVSETGRDKLNTKTHVTNNRMAAGCDLTSDRDRGSVAEEMPAIIKPTTTKSIIEALLSRATCTAPIKSTKANPGMTLSAVNRRLKLSEVIGASRKVRMHNAQRMLNRILAKKPI